MPKRPAVHVAVVEHEEELDLRSWAKRWIRLCLAAEGVDVRDTVAPPAAPDVRFGP